MAQQKAMEEELTKAENEKLAADAAFAIAFNALQEAQASGVGVNEAADTAIAAEQAVNKAMDDLRVAVKNYEAAASAYSAAYNNALKFEHGGTVPGPVGSPQLVMAHGGETIIPFGSGRGNNNNSALAGASAGIGGRGDFIVNGNIYGIENLRQLVIQWVRDTRRGGGFQDF